MLKHPLVLPDEYEPDNRNIAIWCPLQNQMVKGKVREDEIIDDKSLTIKYQKRRSLNEKKEKGYKGTYLRKNSIIVKEDNYKSIYNYFRTIKNRNPDAYLAYQNKARKLKANDVRIGYQWYREDIKRVYFEFLTNLIFLAKEKGKTHIEISNIIDVSSYLITKYFANISKSDFTICYTFDTYMKHKNYNKKIDNYLFFT